MDYRTLRNFPTEKLEGWRDRFRARKWSRGDSLVNGYIDIIQAELVSREAETESEEQH